ncbi:MAG: EAL domain-containing protein [Meiothermus silvanus]|nr:EAL domain-containing protein [Allomeiothermus silvanus]
MEPKDKRANPASTPLPGGPSPPLPNILLSASRTSDASVDVIVLDALRAIREHLGMEVAFVSQFHDGRRYFRFVDSSSADPPIAAGDSDPLEESYCQRVVDGRLPELIRDASQIPAALELPATTALPVGAHLSTTLRLSNGQIYGTICCFSSRPDPTLGERDLALLHLFASFVSQQIERRLEAQHARQKMVERVTEVLEAEAFSTVYQPIFHLAEGRILGFEALTRFSATPARSPDVWFNEAAEVGLGERLEMAVVTKALAGLEHLPPELFLSLNVSPAHLLSGAVARVLEGMPLGRIVLEVTEHVPIPDYSKFAAVLKPLRSQGLRLAVDDAGAGYASFSHILQLDPDLIKLDTTLTRNIDTDRTRRSLAAALIRFAQETGSRIVAEGVETVAERDTLHRLQVDMAQGYLLGHPLPLAEAVALLP